jgi:hypothetical protein
MSNILSKIKNAWQNISEIKKAKIQASLFTTAVLLLLFSFILNHQNERLNALSALIPKNVQLGFFIGCTSALTLNLPNETAILICKDASEEFIKSSGFDQLPLEE